MLDLRPKYVPSVSEVPTIRFLVKCVLNAGWHLLCDGSVTLLVTPRVSQCTLSSLTNSSLHPRTKDQLLKRKKILTRWPKPTRPLLTLLGKKLWNATIH